MTPSALKHKHRRFINGPSDIIRLPSRGESWCQLGQHAVAGREFDKGLAGFGQALVVATEATPTNHPAKTAFNDPPPGQGTEAGRKELFPLNLLSLRNEQAAFGHRERLDGLHPPPQVGLEPQQKVPSIMAITPEQ